MHVQPIAIATALLVLGCSEEASESPTSDPAEGTTMPDPLGATETSTAGMSTEGGDSSSSTTAASAESSSSATGEPSTLTRLRVAVLTVDLEGADVCLDGPQGEVGPLGQRLGSDALDYPVATRYLDVELSSVDGVRLVPAGDDCSATALAEAPVDTRGVAPYQTLVLFGDASLPQVDLSAALFPDETDQPPAAGAKARNIHADPEAPTINVGLISPAGPVFVFREVSYQQTALGTDLGEVSANGYVQGIPSVEFPIRVWQDGTRDPLLELPEVPPFEAGGVYSVFPAGKVFSGTAEAFVCRDAVDLATPEDPWSACFLVVGTLLGDPN